ncbi:unnamed protein product, partial [Brassica oleracea var. botrytis]
TSSALYFQYPRDTWRDNSHPLSNVASYVDGLGVKKTLLYINRHIQTI